MKQHNKRNRQESAIERLEKTLTMHEANTELTLAIIGDHGPGLFISLFVYVIFLLALCGGIC